MQNTDSTNRLFHLAASFVNHTGRHLFLTGKAGTGKTTFLKHIVATTPKKTVVVAPTGVASINAGGVTMHSMFQLPFGPFLPVRRNWTGEETDGAHDKQSLFQKIKINKNKRKLFQELELLIIDEVSMVRADMLDAIDHILRHFRFRYQEPFGGVQVLMIGDLYQLPPVVQELEWNILSKHYKSPYFFDAQVLHETPVLRIELQKIYRQSDKEFIDLLNNVRNNTVPREQLAWLNRRFLPDFRPKKEDNFITLTSHNSKAHAINESELKKLPGKLHKFKAIVQGDFSDRAYPADEVLQLKEGAQVMFIRNDKADTKRYYNGKIGLIESIDEDEIIVSFKEDKSSLTLEMEEWENKHYSYNSEKNSIDEKSVGSFRQYPIRLAWAITIHKSQGLTFDKAIIDAGQSFTAGQVYVALSRLTNMEGLILKSTIAFDTIQTDELVNNFMAQKESEESLIPELKTAQKNFITQKLLQTFEWETVCQDFKDFYEELETKQVPDKTEALELFRRLIGVANEHKLVADKFLGQLKGLVPHAEGDGYLQLLERMDAAKTYFAKRMGEELFEPLQTHLNFMKKQTRVKKYVQDLYGLQVRLLARKALLEKAVVVVRGLSEGKDADLALQNADAVARQATERLPPPPRLPKPKVGDSKQMSLDLFKKGKAIPDIAKERGLSAGTIENHLADFVKTGELSVFQLVTPEKVEKILPLVQKSESFSAGPIKAELGDSYSFGEIRAVINYWSWKKSQD